MGGIQDFVHKQLHAFEHSADAQRYIALGAVDFESELGGDVGNRG